MIQIRYEFVVESKNLFSQLYKRNNPLNSHKIFIRNILKILPKKKKKRYNVYRGADVLKKGGGRKRKRVKASSN
ncbi:hypothetical protein X975_03990, partial [Stegodyphus mimosarum]